MNGIHRLTCWILTMAPEFPTIYLLPKGLDPEYMSELESQIPSLTYDINEAEIVLGKLSQPTRAKWELRTRNVLTEDIQPDPSPDVDHDSPTPPVKGIKVSESVAHDVESNTASDSDASMAASMVSTSSRSENLGLTDEAIGLRTIVKVVKLSWFLNCLEEDTILPLDDYLVYQGLKVSSPIMSVSVAQIRASAIWERARGEDSNNKSDSNRDSQDGHTSNSQHPRTHTRLKRPGLKPESTSEHGRALKMPPIPDFLRTTYSCQRPTRADPPNSAFIKQLKEIRTIRTLIGDKNGARAYSTAISTMAAYPFQISCVPGECSKSPERTVRSNQRYRS